MDTKKSSKKEATRQRILEAVHVGFRKHGYSGAGVDGLAKEADVTSGAFYAHFGSKAAAFREALHMGLSQVKEAIEKLQQTNSENWLAEFSDFYLGEKRLENLSNSCAMQSLSSDVSRSDDETRSIFQTDILKIAEIFSKGLSAEKESVEKTWSTLAMLIGGVTLARAVNDPELANTITESVQSAIKKTNG